MLGLLAVIIIHSAPFDELAQGPKVPQDEVFSYEDGRTFTASNIQFSGNQKVSTKQLKNLTIDFLNRPLSQVDQSEIQHRIELYYKNKGYEDVKVSISPQEKNHTLLVEIEEGKKK